MWPPLLPNAYSLPTLLIEGPDPSLGREATLYSLPIPFQSAISPIQAMCPKLCLFVFHPSFSIPCIGP